MHFYFKVETHHTVFTHILHFDPNDKQVKKKLLKCNLKSNAEDDKIYIPDNRVQPEGV